MSGRCDRVKFFSIFMTFFRLLLCVTIWWSVSARCPLCIWTSIGSSFILIFGLCVSVCPMHEIPKKTTEDEKNVLETWLWDASRLNVFQITWWILHVCIPATLFYSTILDDDHDNDVSLFFCYCCVFCLTSLCSASKQMERERLMWVNMCGTRNRPINYACSTLQSNWLATSEVDHLFVSFG